MPSWKPTRLSVTLPESGLKITVRPITPYDRILVLGKLGDPSIYGIKPEDAKRAEAGEGGALPQDLVGARLMEDTIKLAVAAIVSHPVGQRIVALKPEDLTDGGQVSFYDLPGQDQGALLAAYSKVKSQGREEVPGTLPADFRAGTDGEDKGAAPAGAGLRDTAEPAAPGV